MIQQTSTQGSTGKMLYIPFHCIILHKNLSRVLKSIRKNMNEPRDLWTDGRVCSMWEHFAVVKKCCDCLPWNGTTLTTLWQQVIYFYSASLQLWTAWKWFPEFFHPCSEQREKTELNPDFSGSKKVCVDRPSMVCERVLIAR